MGFSVGYSEPVLLKQLVHLLLLLGYIGSFLLWPFDAVGLDDLLDLKDDHQALLQDAALSQYVAAASPPRRGVAVASPPPTSASSPLPPARR
jgi:RING-H2 zinc finger protein RHA1